MPTKSANNAVELSYINYIPANNTLNFTATPISGGAAIVDATAGVYANGAFLQANLAYSAANNALDSWVRNQANSAFLQANLAYAQANSALSNTNLNVSATLRLLNQGGDEGGELFLDKPVTNTSLSAGITIDIWQNRLRFFETGGGIRGAFIDIANTTANGVSSEITKYGSNTTSTSSLAISQGTTAERPASPANGAIRFNTTLGRIEGYMPSGGWQNILSDSYQVEYLVVAGGGSGGGTYSGGGGGAGGLLTGTGFTVTPNQVYTVTVGAGGATSSASTQGNDGTNSVFSSLTAIGGGGGGTSSGSGIGRSGGSGGGAERGGVPGGTPFPAAGAGTPGQGNPGGLGYDAVSNCTSGGGGGGAGGPGSDSPRNASNQNNAGPGGVGLQLSISGAPVYYAGGGGGGNDQGNASAPGGLGGGGSGYMRGSGGTAGTTNTGGGGGGAGNGPQGAAGGSGIVIIRYLGSQRGLGGTVTSGGGYTVHTFTGSGTFTA